MDLTFFTQRGLLVLSVLLISQVLWIYGAHVCGFYGYTTTCCKGWIKDANGQCVVPVCNGNCGNGGKCIRPNTCRCADESISYSCGWNGINNDSPLQKFCPNQCSQHGKCDNGVCACDSGYKGPACDVEEKGPCYRKIDIGMCVNRTQQPLLSQAICCGTFEVAWGDPCRRCSQNYCGKGYYMNRGACTDIDECKIQGVCRNGVCVNTRGSYECSCRNSYQFNKEMGECIFKPDFCEKNPKICGAGGQCIDTDDGSYTCKCSWSSQQSADKKSCVPKTRLAFNFCNFYRGFLCENGECIPLSRTYECKCNPGFSESPDRKSCTRKIDVCKLNHGMLCKNGKCISVGSDYMCQCNPGYQKSYDSKKCISVCDLYPTSLCQNGRCIPKPTTYECECNSGFYLSSNKQSCKPSGSYAYKSSDGTNFCSYDVYRNKCLGGKCKSVTGSYQCECLPGFVSTQNGLACQKGEAADFAADQSKSIRVNPKVRHDRFCALHGSSACTNGRCQRSGSSYECICNSGFKRSANGKQCTDVDECVLNPTICSQGTCTNTPGGYTCNCFRGYAIHYVGGKQICYDQDECEEQDELCQNGQCLNRPGTYECLCNPGYIPDVSGHTCVSRTSQGIKATATKDPRCKECIYGCIWISKDAYHCECPKGLSQIGSTGLCGDTKFVSNYKLDVQYQQTERKKRSVAQVHPKQGPHTADSHLTPGEHTFLFDLVPIADVNKFLHSLQPGTTKIHKKACSTHIIMLGYEVFCKYMRD